MTSILANRSPRSWFTLTARIALPLAAWALTSSEPATAGDLSLHRSTVLHFATVDEAAEIIGREDVFLQRMGPVERQLRLGSSVPVPASAYRDFARQQVLPWTTEEKELLAATVQELRVPLNRLKDVWPATIDLIKSTGREEGNAPHCRSDAIVLPARFLREEPQGLKKLLLHELFHILSRQSPTRQASLYSIVGFQFVAPIELPQSMRDRRITNPDAPQIDCVVTLQHNNAALHLAPVLLTKQSTYDTEDQSLFSEMLFRLMPVEQHGQRWVPTADACEGKLWQAREIPEYAKTIGRNTPYIIHPEEVLADNFVLLVTGSDDVPDPWIITRLGKQLFRAD